jgi:LemA protein
MGLIFLFVVVILLYGILGYNALIKGRLHVQEAWSGIDVQLKRRHDLIPNIVESVKGYMQHERQTLEQVTALRAQASGAAGVKEKAALENDITRSFKTIFAVAENYPDLKANQNFLDLQVRLAEVEDEIQLARRYYNGTVRDFNIKVQSFPSNIVANMFQFKIEQFFEIETVSERAVPKVDLKK